jgi:membrane associated rhomboid family serine protease
MTTLGRFSIATLCALVTLGGAAYLGMLFLLLFDPHYHDGFAAVGGCVFGVISAVLVFYAVVKKRAH